MKIDLLFLRLLSRVARGFLLSAGLAGLMGSAHAQITPIADTQANFATWTQLASWRKSSTTVVALAVRVDPVAFVDGGVIVFPLPNLQPVQLRLALQPGRTSFTAISTDPRFVSAVITVIDGVYVGITMVLVGGDSYQLIPVESGGNQHVLVRQDMHKHKDSSPSGNPTNEPLRWGPGGTNINKVIQSIRPLASGSGPAPIDILFVYGTSIARAGGIRFATGGAMELLASALSGSRDYTGHNDLVSAKIVGLAEVNVRASIDGDTQLAYLAQDATVKALRDQYSADIVVLLVDTELTHPTIGDLGGVAYQTPQPEFGYAVISRNYLNAFYIFAHEIGHVLGADHGSAYTHFATLAQKYCYRTIMAYDVNCTTLAEFLAPFTYTTPINVYSNPRGAFFLSGPGLIPTSAGPSQNNWGNIAANAWRVASFREPFLKTLTITPASITLPIAVMQTTLVVSGVNNQGNAIATTGLVWTSTNNAYATVSPTGVVTFLQAGTTVTIQATLGTVTATASVTSTKGHVGIGPPNCRNNPRLCA